MAKAKMTKKEKNRIENIIKLLNKEYGTDMKSFLNHETPWQLLVATILSAQCTDDRVNMVTKELFKKFNTVEEFASADLKDLEKAIYSTGFYKTKAKNIIQSAKRIIDEYEGIVPKEIEDLTSLAGVGRKTANVIRSNIFNEPSIVVDTHVMRVSKRLGLTKEKDPVKIEFELMAKLPKEQWIPYNIQIISLGRSICLARKPRCGECFLQNYCPSRKLD